MIEKLIEILSATLETLQTSQEVAKVLSRTKEREVCEGRVAAAIHRQNRMDATQKAFFVSKGRIDDREYTKACYAKQELEAIKQVSILLCRKEKDRVCCKPKFPADKWKKIVDEGILATVETESFDPKLSDKAMESVVRDHIRSNKETPALKAKPFVLTVRGDKRIENLITHYFPTCNVSMAKSGVHFALSRSDTLERIDMRGFVYDLMV